jgi:hypothetical protein
MEQAGIKPHGNPGSESVSSSTTINMTQNYLQRLPNEILSQIISNIVTTPSSLISSQPTASSNPSSEVVVWLTLGKSGPITCSSCSRIISTMYIPFVINRNSPSIRALSKSSSLFAALCEQHRSSEVREAYLCEQAIAEKQHLADRLVQAGCRRYCGKCYAGACRGMGRRELKI